MAVGKIFHYRERESIFTALNPLFKLLVLLLFCVAASFDDPVSVSGCLLLAVVLWLCAGIPFSMLYRNGLFFLFLAVVIAFTSSLQKGAAFLSIVMASLIFMDCTAPTDLAYALGNGKFGAVVGITLAMIPGIVDCIATTMQARKARGERLLSHPVKALSGICIGVISKLFDLADNYSDALVSRGFNS